MHTHAGGEGGEGHEEDSEPEDAAGCGCGELHAAVLLGAGADGDEPLILHQPVDATQEEVAVPHGVEEGVADEVGVDGDGKSGLFAAPGGTGDGGADQEWALRVVGGVEPSAFGTAAVS